MAKAAAPMEVTLLGMATDKREVQLAKAAAPMEVTLLGMLIEMSEAQPKNAFELIAFHVFGIMTCPSRSGSMLH